MTACASPTTSRSRQGSSRLGGVPTVLPERSVDPPGQMALPFEPAGREIDGIVRREVLPGVVHVPGWLDARDPAPRSWRSSGRGRSRPPGCAIPGCRAVTPDERAVGVPRLALAALRVHPDRRRHRRRPGEAAPGRASSTWPARPSRRATAPRSEAARRFAPDAAIVNLYAPGARLGLHSDGEEPADAPVVTISLGDTCMFRLAGVDRRTGPFTDIELRSGDLLVFGGANRRIYHGVPEGLRRHRPRRGSASRPGRLSITVRETGLSC